MAVRLFFCHVLIKKMQTIVMHQKPTRSPAQRVRVEKEEQRSGTRFQGGPQRDRLKTKWSGFRSDVVPVVGLEPTRGISPTDFEFCKVFGTHCLLKETVGTYSPLQSLAAQGVSRFDDMKLLRHKALRHFPVVWPQKAYRRDIEGTEYHHIVKLNLPCYAHT